MIITALFNSIVYLFNLIPFSLPNLPNNFISTLESIFNGITSSFNILAIFINLHFWLICSVVMIILYNIKFIYNLFIFLLNLIPGINIKNWN